MTAALVYITFALSLIATALHFIAPRTKNTVDDKLSDGVDAVIDLLPKRPEPAAKA